MLASLGNHRDLGIHTELISDGVVDLVEQGVATGTRKTLRPNKVVTTFALDTTRLYDLAAREPRGRDAPGQLREQPAHRRARARLRVDQRHDGGRPVGQCASETMAGRYWSSSGGQADFARGAMYSEGGQAFIVLHSTTGSGMSRIRVRLTEGSVVTTLKNTVDHVVTEYGVAKLRGRSIAERARALVAIAQPDHRDALETDARAAGIWGAR